jgi:hypothetical protein
MRLLDRDIAYLVRDFARAAPPFAPWVACAALLGAPFLNSPVAIRTTRTALPMTSAGRFSPLGPFGIRE